MWCLWFNCVNINNESNAYIYIYFHDSLFHAKPFSWSDHWSDHVIDVTLCQARIKNSWRPVPSTSEHVTSWDSKLSAFHVPGSNFQNYVNIILVQNFIKRKILCGLIVLLVIIYFCSVIETKDPEKAEAVIEIVHQTKEC